MSGATSYDSFLEPFLLNLFQDIVLAHSEHVVEHAHGDDVVVTIEGVAPNAQQAVAIDLYGRFNKQLRCFLDGESRGQVFDSSCNK